MEPYKKHGSPFRIYYGSVTDFDRQVGRLLQRPEDLGLAENTILLFSSDNGPEDILIDNTEEHGVGDPGPFRGRKRSGYEGGVRVPLLVRWPKALPAGRVDARIKRRSRGKTPASVLGLREDTVGNPINRSPKLIIREGR